MDSSAYTHLVAVPAFNEAKNIGRLVEQLLDYITAESILIIDDGSSDGTLEVARSTPARVIAHGTNKGKGEALKTAFRVAQAEGFRGVITIDADLQHDPALIPDFIQLADTGKYDLIVGRRIRTPNMPLERKLTNYGLSILISLFAGVRIRDTQSGYRWISCDTASRLRLRSCGYELETELLLMAGRLGARIGEIQIPTIYSEDAKSHIQPLRDTIRMARLIGSSLFW